ncbi:hypothetical protein DPMN_090264 [Dreissena polymorpha]|uniref:Uncharacterized protein n=1 Tax=Dreissena polymorpha TaxID=45954 RepID=A0A9D4KXE2_DREPO|nr:hypothetical protein DPMN_090264 [Dreissena polymorpha]
MTLELLIVILLIVNITKRKDSPSYKHHPTYLAGVSVKCLRHRFWNFCEPAKPMKNLSLLTCILLLCGDIESNPGPVANAQVYPCGLCDLPVTWEHQTPFAAMAVIYGTIAPISIYALLITTF